MEEWLLALSREDRREALVHFNRWFHSRGERLKVRVFFRWLGVRFKRYMVKDILRFFDRFHSTHRDRRWWRIRRLLRRLRRSARGGIPSRRPGRRGRRGGRVAPAAPAGISSARRAMRAARRSLLYRFHQAGARAPLARKGRGNRGALSEGKF